MKSMKLFIFFLIVLLSVLLTFYFNSNSQFESYKQVELSDNDMSQNNYNEIKITVETTNSGFGVVENDASCFCSQRYEPVCGRDGKTYGNACLAQCAKVPIIKNTICN